MRDMNAVIGKLGGKKFLVTLGGAAVLILHNWLGLSTQSATEIVGLLMTYVVGQSVADGWSGGATSSVAAANAEAKAMREMAAKK
jgi:hypothetical protein